MKQMAFWDSSEDKLEREELHVLRRILRQLEQILEQDQHHFDQVWLVLLRIANVFNSRLATFQVYIFTGGTMPKTINVGDTATAIITNARDQFGNPFTIDFAVNPPVWTISDSSLVSQTPNQDGTDSLVALAEGTESVMATIGSVSASDSLTIALPPPPPSVLTAFDVQVI